MTWSGKWRRDSVGFGGKERTALLGAALAGHKGRVSWTELQHLDVGVAE